MIPAGKLIVCDIISLDGCLEVHGVVSWPCLSNMRSPKQRFDSSFQACGAELTLELPAYPDHPPMRWSSEANTAAVGLSFHSVDEVITRLSWPREAEAIFDVSISRRADGGHVVAAGDGSQRLEFLAEGYRIDRFSSYVVSRDDW